MYGFCLDTSLYGELGEDLSISLNKSFLGPLIRLNRALIREGLAPYFDDSSVRFDPHDRMWYDARVSNLKGRGNCNTFTAWLIASLRERGVTAKVGLGRVGPTMLHFVVLVEQDGRWTYRDPSVERGMVAPPWLPEWYRDLLANSSTH